MTLRKPLVLIEGQVSRLSDSDTLSVATLEANSITTTTLNVDVVSADRVDTSYIRSTTGLDLEGTDIEFKDGSDSLASLDLSGLSETLFTIPSLRSGAIFSLSTKTNDSTPGHFVVQSQAAFASATGANRTSGNVKIVLPFATNGGTSASQFQICAGNSTSPILNVYSSSASAASNCFILAENELFLSSKITDGITVSDQNLSNTIFIGTVTGATGGINFSETFTNGIRIFQSTRSDPGAGYDFILEAQEAVDGVGGRLILRGGVSSDPGSILSGAINLDVGLPVSSETAKVNLTAASSGNFGSFKLSPGPYFLISNESVATEGIYFSSSRSILAQASQNIEFETLASYVAFNQVTGVKFKTSNISDGSNDGSLTFTLPNTGAHVINHGNGATNCSPTSVTYTIPRRLSGGTTGAGIIIESQQGQVGSVGGDLVLRSGRGGTPGTDLAGQVILDAGELVSNATAKIAFHAGSNGEFGYIRENLGYTYLGNTSTSGLIISVSGGLAATASGVVNFESSGSNVIFRSGTDNFQFAASNGAVVLDYTMPETGAYALTFGNGSTANPSSITMSVTQATSGSAVGSDFTIRAQQGRPGAVGGNLRLISGLGGTPGTNKAGNIVLEIGAGQTDGDSARASVQSNGTEVMHFRNYFGAYAIIYSSFANGLLITSTGVVQTTGTTIAFESTSGVIQYNSANSIFRFISASAVNGSAEGALTYTLSNAGSHTIAHGNGSNSLPTSVTYQITKQGTTGTTTASDFIIKAQDGRNVAAGTNNSGGHVILQSGAVGTGGTGGASGNVQLKTASTTRLEISGDGSLINMTATEFRNTGSNNCIFKRYDEGDTGGTTKEDGVFYKYQTIADAGSFTLWTDSNVPEIGAIYYKVTMVARCISGTDINTVMVAKRETVVDRDSGAAPVMDANYNSESEQRIGLDSAPFPGNNVLWTDSGNNMILSLTKKNTDEWKIYTKVERIAVKP